MGFMRNMSRSGQKIVLYAAGFIPFVLLALRAALGRLGANPVQTLMISTGDWTMRLLLATLSITPLQAFINLPHASSLRRQLGLLALFYGCLHFIIYIGLDYLFDVGLILREAPGTPFVIVGFGSFILLLLLGITSPKGLASRMSGKQWRNVHRLVYLAGIGGIVHYRLKSKVIGTELIIYTAVLAVLLLYRLVLYIKKSKNSI